MALTGKGYAAAHPMADEKLELCRFYTASHLAARCNALIFKHTFWYRKKAGTITKPMSRALSRHCRDELDLDLHQKDCIIRNNAEGVN